MLSLCGNGITIYVGYWTIFIYKSFDLLTSKGNYYFT